MYNVGCITPVTDDVKITPCSDGQHLSEIKIVTFFWHICPPNIIRNRVSLGHQLVLVSPIGVRVIRCESTQVIIRNIRPTPEVIKRQPPIPVMHVHPTNHPAKPTMHPVHGTFHVFFVLPEIIISYQRLRLFRQKIIKTGNRQQNHQKKIYRFFHIITS